MQERGISTKIMHTSNEGMQERYNNGDYTYLLLIILGCAGQGSACAHCRQPA